MNTQKMAVGYQLGGMAPLGINRALTYFARLSQFDSVWLPDHWQGIIPSALWKQEFPWAASQHDSPHALFGSGSLEQDGPLSIVAMEKEEQACLMHQHRLGKR